MRIDRVVVSPLLLDDDFRFFQSVEDLTIEKFISEFAVR